IRSGSQSSRWEDPRPRAASDQRYPAYSAQAMGPVVGGAEASGVHPTTVDVPAYGDPSTLIPCVESLLANVDQSVHRVLLVNDCGPQADEIEKALLTLIDGQAAFAYARNPRNLGFVGTCNRAAYELDTTDNDILFLNSDTVT